MIVKMVKLHRELKNVWRCWVYLIKKKSNVFEVFKVYKAWVELDSRKKIKCLRTNNGDEYTSDEFDTFCKQEGIKRQFTTAYTHQQNGVAERMNRTLLERARVMLATASLENHSGQKQSIPHKSCVRDVQYPRNYKAGSKIQKMLVLGEPLTLQEALNNPDASSWKEARQEEIKALHKNKT
ncbi:gag-pol polyprotein [Tanacetum coccineum]|uniref:Gag-pol polyprotein n=1 Tax=Tanacetum coccineum TaxID=301880 RepID=A0ABQ5J9M0_9ASTR